MGILKISSTDISPEVNFDPAAGNFSIRGESRPENSGKFYEPILSWIEENKTEAFFNKPVSLEMKLDYFNSSSSKYILDLLLLLESFKDEGADISIKWCFNKGEEDIQEAGEEFADIVSLPFVFVEE